MPLDYVDKYDAAGDAQASMLGKVKNYTLATAADVVTSLWNSLPLTPEWKTEDLLGAVDQDASQFFRENRDTVETSSLIAGSLIPGTAGIKLLSRARSGIGALGYSNNLIGSFTGVRQAGIRAEMEKIFNVAGTAGAQYDKLKRDLLVANVSREVIDNAIIELAVVGSMNAHPYMSDYFDSPGDFAKNFALGTAFGAGLGGIFAYPTTRREIKQWMQPLEAEAIFKAHSGYKTVDESFTAAAKYQAHTANILRFQQTVLDEESTPYVREMAAYFQEKEKARRAEVLNGVGDWVKGASPELRDQLSKILSDERFIGVDKIRFYDMDKSVANTPTTIRLFKQKDEDLMDEMNSYLNDVEELQKIVPSPTKPRKGILNTLVSGESKDVLIFARMSTGEIFHAAGARNAAIAADNPAIKEVLKTGHSSNFNVLTSPVNDWGEENLLRSISSVQADTRFLKELKLANDMPDSVLEHIVIDPHDLPRMNAMLHKWSQLNQEQKAKLSVKIRSDRPTYNDFMEYVKVRSGVGADYEPRVKSAIDTYSFRNVGVSKDAEEMLADWIHGHGPKGDISAGMAALRRAFDNFFHKTDLSEGDPLKYRRIAEELWNSGAKLREELRKVADPEGFIYLYRGFGNKGRENIKSHSTVESWTIKNISGFGKQVTGRVHVDNIIGSIGSGNLNEAEILVAPPHHEFVDNIPRKTAASSEVNIRVKGAESSITQEELMVNLAYETEAQLKDMIKNGFSREEISARLNIKKEAVEMVYAGKHLTDLAKEADDFEWRRYTDPDKIDEYISPANKMFALVGNKNKNHLAESMANLDGKDYTAMHRKTVEQITLGSDSKIAKSALDIFNHNDVKMFLDDLMLRIGEMNNSNVGSTTFQSADNALRGITRSSVITHIGKEIINNTDRIKKELLEPLANLFMPMRTNPAMLAEFNNVVNKLYSLKGWRDIVPDEGSSKWFIVQKAEDGKTLRPVKNADNTLFYIQQPEVIQALHGMREPSTQLMKMHNVNRAATGQAPISDMGFYVPPINLVNKNYALVIDNTGKSPVKLLVSGDEKGLSDLITTYRAENPGQHIDIVPKGDQLDHNLVKNYVDYESLTTYANVAMRHSGASSLAITPGNTDLLQNIIGGYENLILQGIRKYTDIYLNDVTGWLDKLSSFYQRFSESQPKGPAVKENAPDAARTIKNILLGRDQLEQSVPLKWINTQTDMLLNRAYNTANTILGGSTKPNKATYDKLVEELKQKGIQPIWKSFDEWAATQSPQTRNIAPEIVSAGNGLLATMQLRMFEIAHASVNIMSLPILTWSALMEKMPGTNIGATAKHILNPDGTIKEIVNEVNSIKFPLRIMYGGIRHMFSAEGRDIEERLFIPRGHIDQTTRQYTETIAAAKAASMDSSRAGIALKAINDFQNSKAVELLSKPSDFAERFTRRIAMHIGYFAAKQAYPGISEMGATMAAVSFADRSIGNYHAAQRPTLFQGTFGAAIGLYQTYFLTFAQHVYRGLESRNFAQLAGLSALQAGIFGISSWPGFKMLSEQVVSRFNDEQYDLTTGTFRAADRHTAELILYGLPSSLGPAWSSRGDIAPRIPSGLEDIAMVNGLREGWNSLHKIVSKAGEGVNNGTPIQSLFEALSLQSINRPIARWSELVTGSSVTSQGNTVSPSNEVWSPIGIASRILAVRPIEEQVSRDARHLDTYYGQRDFENRQQAMGRLKTALRAGHLTDSLISEVAADYLKNGGSSKGWRSAVNETLLKSDEGTSLALRRKLEPDSPIQHMIQDMY